MQFAVKRVRKEANLHLNPPVVHIFFSVGFGENHKIQSQPTCTKNYQTVRKIIFNAAAGKERVWFFLFYKRAALFIL